MTIDHLRTAIAEQVPRLQSWEVDGLAKKLEREGLLRVPRGEWPEWATYRATDANGAVYFYATKPEPGQATWMQPSAKRNLPDTSVATNWKDTLETRDEPQGLEVRKG